MASGVCPSPNSSTPAWLWIAPHTVRAELASEAASELWGPPQTLTNLCNYPPGFYAALR